MVVDGHGVKKAAIRQNYITRINVSIRDLSKEFDVPVGTIGKWSSEENWYEKRKKYQSEIDEAALNQVKSELVSERVQMIKDIDYITKKAIATLKRAVDDGKELTVTQINILAKLSALLSGDPTHREERIVRLDVDPATMSLEDIRNVKRQLNMPETPYEEI